MQGEQLIEPATDCITASTQDCSKAFGPEYSYDGVQAGFGPLAALCKTKCKWTGYSGSKMNCCLNGNDSPRSCDPTLTYSSGNCDDVFASYCAQGSNIITDQKCINWASARPASAAPLMKRACIASTLGAGSVCRNWCMNNQGQCDDAMAQYCKSYPNDPMCRCYTSPAAQYNAICIDKDCRDTGYKTAAMLTTQCPTQIDCKQYITLAAGGKINFTDNTVIQRCGNDGGGVNTAGSGSTSSNGGSTTTTSNIPTQTPTLFSSITVEEWILFAFIFLIFVAIIVIVAIAT